LPGFPEKYYTQRAQRLRSEKQKADVLKKVHNRRLRKLS
jgi:hypothetical protein